MSTTAAVVSPVSEVSASTIHSYRLVNENDPVTDIYKGTVNIHELTQGQRIGLIRGPTASVYINNQPVGYIRVRAGMALSPVIHAFVQQHPEYGINFPEGAAHEQGMRTILRYFSYHFLGGKTVLRIPFGRDFVHTLRIYQAAIALGLEAHVDHIVAFLHQHIKRDDVLLGYGEFEALLDAFGPGNRIFNHVVTRYAKLRYENAIPDPEQFKHFVDAHPVFANAMAEVDARHTREREFYANQREQKLLYQERQKKREARKAEEEKKAEKEKAEKLKADKLKADKLKAEKAEKAKKKAQEPRLTRSADATKRSKEFWAKFN